MANGDLERGQGNPLGSGPGASPPFRPECRARRLSGIDGFAECLTPSSDPCQFLFRYGHGLFCTHPQREQIIARTWGEPPGC